MRVRIYNPNAGRFDQVDRVLGGNANPYDYIFQNPLTRFDLTGLKSGKNYDPTHWRWWGFKWDMSRRTAQFFVLIVGFVNAGFGQLQILIGLLPPRPDLQWSSCGATSRTSPAESDFSSANIKTKA